MRARAHAGGCPYAKGATGNVATEHVLALMARVGMHTGVDAAAVEAAGHFICDHLQRPRVSAHGHDTHTPAE